MIKSRMVRWVRHIAQNLEGKDCFLHSSIAGRIMLEWSLEK